LLILKTTDYYELIKLSPAYRVYFGVDEFIAIADNLPEIEATLRNIEKGSGAVLHDFMMEAQSNYNIADLVYRPVFHH
jgi:phytoene desaturase